MHYMLLGTTKPSAGLQAASSGHYFRQRRVAMLDEQPIEGLLLADGELPGLDARVIYTKQRVDVVH